MANHKSSKKRARQTPVRTARNQDIKSSVKTAVRTFREALKSGDKEKLAEAFRQATRSLRRAASKGVLHKANASRRVSRLTQAFNKAA